MASISNALQFTTREIGYLAHFVGWSGADLPVAVAIFTQESRLNNGEYRPITQNSQGGNDWGMCMVNDKHQKATIDLLLGGNPFLLMHPMTALSVALYIWQGSGWGPWNYGPNAYGPKMTPTPRPARTDAEIGLPAIKAEIGAAPFEDIDSPYWRMKDARIDTRDLPVPPISPYISTLPSPTGITYNKGGYPPNVAGVGANLVQWNLREEGLWPTGRALDYWFGPTVSGNLSVLENTWKSAGFWTGDTTGKIYDADVRRMWDAIRQWEYLARYR